MPMALREADDRADWAGNEWRRLCEGIRERAPTRLGYLKNMLARRNVIRDLQTRGRGAIACSMFEGGPVQDGRCCGSAVPITESCTVQGARLEALAMSTPDSQPEVKGRGNCAHHKGNSRKPAPLPMQ